MKLRNGVTMLPPKAIIYGAPGAGKTTLGAQAEGGVIQDWEGGAGRYLNVTDYLDTWPKGRDMLLAEASNRTIHGPLVIDTGDQMLDRIVQYVNIDLDKTNAGDIRNTLGSSHGGFFKGREIVLNILQRELFPILERIVVNGTPIIILCHAENKDIVTPEGFNQKKAAPLLPDWVIGKFFGWVDMCLYLDRAADGTRSLLTEGTSLIVAKNRYSMPPRIPATWQDIVANMR